MNFQDAQKIFGFTSTFNANDVKATYRKLCSKFHPDRNPAGEEMMKMINPAYDKLKQAIAEGWDTKGVSEEQANYGDEINTAINAIIDCEGVLIEICGSFVWLTGETKTHKEAIKAAGFRWSKNKTAWYKSPIGFRKRSKRSWELGEIREEFGSDKVKTKGKAKLQSA